MQKILIYIGVLVLLAGLLWPWLRKLPFGRLPGDFMIQKENFAFYFPLTSMILLSLLVTLLIWLFRR